MDKRHFFIRYLQSGFMLSALFFSNYSCVDNRYDLNKDISKNVGIEGELGFPLGETEEKALRDLLSPEDIADLDTTDGAYGIHKKDVITAEIGNLSDISAINSILAYTRDFDITFKNITLDPIQISGHDYTVSLDKGADIAKPNMDLSLNGLNVDLSTDYSLPIPIPSGNIGNKLPAISLSPQPINFTIAGFSCPEQIISVSAIEFDGTDNAEIVWDLSDVQRELGLSGGEVKIKSFQINFPEGFVLSTKNGTVENNGRSLKLDGQNLVFGKNTIKFTVERYNHAFTNENGTIKGLDEQITFGSGGSGNLSIEISDGTTSGIAAGDHTLSMPLSLSSSLKVKDMNMKLDNISIQSEEFLAMNAPIKVTGINSMVGKINKINFDENTLLTIESTPLNLGGLTLSGDNILIHFSSKFHFDETEGNWNGGRLVITPSDLKNGFRKPLKVLYMDLSDVNLEDDNESGTKFFEFDPELQVGKALLTVGGEAKYSDLTALNGNRDLTISILPTSFSIDDGECETEVYTTRVDETADFSVADIALPDEIEDLGWIRLKEPKTVNLELEMTGIPTGAGDLSFQTVYLDFPDFIELTKDGEPLPWVEDENTGTKYRRYEITEDKFAKNGNVRSWSNKKGSHLEITGLDLTKVDQREMKEGKLSFHDAAKVYGIVALDKSTLELSELNRLTIYGKGSVSIGNQGDDNDNLEIGVVAGIISDKAIQDLNLRTAVDLGDLGDYLGEGSKLYLPRVNFKLQASNPLGVGVDCDLKFTPYKNGRPLFDDAVLPISIKANDDIENPESYGLTNLMIVGKEYPANVPVPEGYEKITFDRLSDVLADIPDSIVIEARPDIQTPPPGSWHTVNLGRETNDVSFSYEAGVPFVLGDGVQIVYRDTIADIQKDLDEILGKVKVSELILNVKVTNGIPLNLKLQLTALNSNSKKIEGLKVLFNDDSKGNIAAGSYNFDTSKTEPAVSVVQIRIVDETPKSSALRQLDALDLRLEGGLGENEGTEGGVPLKTSQSIKVKVGAKVRGLEADIDNL